MLPNETNLNHWLELLQSPSDFDKIFAAEAIGKIGDPNATEALLNVLRNENVTDRDVILNIDLALERIGADSIPRLIEVTLDESEWTKVRVNVIEVLAEIGSPRVEVALLTLLRDQKVPIRIAAIDALGKIARAEIIPLLEKVALEDQGLMDFTGKVNFGNRILRVTEAANEAIAKIRSRSIES